MTDNLAKKLGALQQAGELASVHRLVGGYIDATQHMSRGLFLSFARQRLAMLVAAHGLHLVFGEHSLKDSEELMEISTIKPWSRVLGRAVASAYGVENRYRQISFISFDF